MYGALTAHRKLDVGNPNAGHIGADFSGLGFSWNEAAKKSPDSVSWKQDIEDLAAWRNAIAHQDFQDRVKLKLTPHRPTLVAADVNAWQTSIERFSSFMDDYLADRLETVIGQRPW